MLPTGPATPGVAIWNLSCGLPNQSHTGIKKMLVSSSIPKFAKRERYSTMRTWESARQLAPIYLKNLQNRRICHVLM